MSLSTLKQKTHLDAIFYSSSLLNSKIRKICPSLPQIILVSMSMHRDIQFCIVDTQGLNSAVMNQKYLEAGYIAHFFSKGGTNIFC